MNNNTKNQGTMNNISELPDPAQIKTEAGEWIIKLDGDNELNPAEHQAFKAWMARSPAHREAVKSMAQFWGKMNVLTELAMPRQKPATPTENAGRKTTPRRPLVIGFGSYATAFSLFALVTLLSVQWLTPSNSNGLYATAVGQQTTITLSDGSELQLNTNSQVKVDYSDQHRNIQLLQGEAHFTVAKDKQRPFSVAAGHGVVQAIGTAFAVYLNRDDIEVVITEGTVGLQSRPITPTDPATNTAPNNPHDLGQLSAGQGAVIKSAAIQNALIAQANTGNPPTLPAQATITTLSPQEIERRLSWRKGFVIFKGAPLAQVVEEVGRYSQITIELAGPDIGAIKIGGQFRVGEVDAMLESLEQNFGLTVKHVSYNHVQLSQLPAKTNQQ